MIGVISNPGEEAVAREFFELFKTPWEFFRERGEYDVVLSTKDIAGADLPAKLVLVYSPSASPKSGNLIEAAGRFFSYKDFKIPIYGNLSQDAGCSVAEHSRVVRIGYDLFSEIRILLTTGQPVANTEFPTLELHISLLRDLIVANGIQLVEVPPIPSGYRFIACLTHDVDHPSLRLHQFDHTMFGFLYRAVVGSVIAALRGRASLGKVLKNWAAALKLPLVFLRLVEDFWANFDKAYAEIEGGLPSTYFVIPTSAAGRTATGPAPKARAARYSLSDVQSQIKNLTSTAHEIGTHGIDAWIDSNAGREEMKRVCDASSTDCRGVRMHWLYFQEESPAILEAAGASYDSTVGYNETVGYRAGTTQAFVPLNATKLVELPMHVMDTALFYPAYLDLSVPEAMQRVTTIIDNAVRYGGVVTINWHDRSTAPERLWGDAYSNIIRQLRDKGAWFATAGEAVEWFRVRRSIVFEGGRGDVHVEVRAENQSTLPSLCVRVHNPSDSSSKNNFESKLERTMDVAANAN